MKILFQEILNNFIDQPQKIDSNNKLYQYLNNEIPKKIESYINRDDLKVYGSMGKGRKTDYPWVAILNKNITTTTQEGLYIVYLFKKDMSGFYLSLNQGITNFEKRFGNKKYDYAQKVASYYQEELGNYLEFSKAPIDLNAKRSTLGYGYERTNILSKYYDKDELDNKVLYSDLEKMLFIYDDVYKHMGNLNYQTVIERVIFSDEVYLGSEEALKEINLILKEESSYPQEVKKIMTQMQPLEEKSRRFKKLTDQVHTKIDFLKKAQTDAYTGLEGEKLALEYERDRLIRLGLSDYVDKVDWVASYNDVAGYDIRSFDLIDNEVKEIYIEVKTSTNKVDTDFYVSKNEVETSERLNKQYFVFRIYNVLSINPKFYIAKGTINENFYLEPVTFKATYKFTVS